MSKGRTALRCFAPPGAWESGIVSLDRAESHHLLHVLRADTSAAVTVFDGAGRSADGVLEKRGKDAHVVLASDVRVAERPVPRVVLLQAVAKAGRMDWIVEKGVELGLSVLVPVVTERTVVRMGKRERQARRERWERIARNAARQCGCDWVPEIEFPCGLNEALDTPGRADLFIVGSLQFATCHLRDVVTERSAARDVRVLIGPEGDLTEDEQQAAIRAGAVPVSLGSRTLRVETASILVLGVLACMLGEGERETAPA